MVPTCLTLNDKQLRILDEFVESLPKRDVDDMDCCMSSDITFQVYTSGIGDIVYAIHGDSRVWLDDGFDP